MLLSQNQLEDPSAIRMVFQRACRSGGEVGLRLEGRDAVFPILEEARGRIALGISGPELNRLHLDPGDRIPLTVFDRGQRYQGTAELAEVGDLEGCACLRLEVPRMLRGRDYRGLADHHPEKPGKAVFTSPNLDFCEARIRALGRDGLQLPMYGTGAVREGQLRQGAVTTLELTLDADSHFVLPAVTESLEDGAAGLRFTEKADAAVLRDYRQWLSVAMAAQSRRDLELFQPAGLRTSEAEGEAARSVPQAQILSDRDPLVLVIAEPAFSSRMAEAVGRKFGVACLDYTRGDVRPALASLGVGGGDWGRVKLVLVHQRLRVMSGMELASRLIKEEDCPLPLLVAGAEEEAALKRNRAITMGAVDFIVVDPFRILTVIQALDQTFHLFYG